MVPAPDSNATNDAVELSTIEETAPTETEPMIYQPEDDPGSEAEVPRRITRRLYVSHFLSTWNSRSFEFGAVLFLATIFPQTLLQLSVYALLRSASAIVLASSIGYAVDQRPRLPVVRLSIVAARIAVLLSCVGFWALSTFHVIPMWTKPAIISVLVLLSCIEKPCSVLNLVAIERDWVVEIAQHDERSLQSLNASMRRIDLVCKLGGPLVIALIDGVSRNAAIFLVLATNAVAAPIEYFAIAQVRRESEWLEWVLRVDKVYGAVPQLQAPKIQSASRSSDQTVRISARQLLAPFRDLKHYSHHPAFLPSLSLSLLYFTVLSMSGQQVAYLVSAGYTSFAIGLVRSVSTMFELSATWIAPLLMHKIGATRAGMWFLSWQVTWLGGAVSFFWVEKKPIVAASGLVAGTILSRIGLWGYDLCAQFIIQQEVQGPQRGSFSSTEATLQNLFELLSYVTTIIWSSPRQFRYPVLLSTVAVYTAAGLYAYFLRQRRGHLVHLSGCVK
ncbi:iron-regulated transporter [Cladophialophora carrionii]|uniref:Solute carrier family 40 member n=1 Tax=Cladophialophora carrionii TaxID=86049 RepID=A0A1C1CTY1_9EURO|nr:iron-regulated transporter [Cladophialophora carrionii]